MEDSDLREILNWISSDIKTLLYEKEKANDNLERNLKGGGVISLKKLKERIKRKFKY